MKPVSGVVPGFDEVVIAKDQLQYLPLPAIVCEDGTVISKWRLSFRERIKVLFSGYIWLQQLSFHEPLQPQLPSADQPKLAHKLV